MTEKKIKHFPTNEKIGALLKILTSCHTSSVFDISSDAKVRKLMDRFTNENCTIKYVKMREVIRDAQCTYKLYTSDNLMQFFTNPEVIDYICNSDTYNFIKVIYPKKYVSALDNKEWKKLEYVPVKDEATEELAKLERHYKEFCNNPCYYRIRKFNPEGKYLMNYRSMVVYDNKNPKDITNVYEFPLDVSISDNAHYIKMCKVHWVKENKFNISEKFADARIMETNKYRETFLNIKLS